MLESIRHTAHAYWIFFVAFIAYNIVVPAPPAAPPAMAKSRYPTHLKIVFNVSLIVVRIKKRGVTRTQPVVCKPVAAFCAFTPTLRSMFNVQCSMFNVQRLSSGPLLSVPLPPRFVQCSTFNVQCSTFNVLVLVHATAGVGLVSRNVDGVARSCDAVVGLLHLDGVGADCSG